MSEKLKPCPFCGSNEIAKIKYASIEPPFVIRCKKCCAHTAYYANEIDAIKGWNTHDIRLNDCHYDDFVKYLRNDLKNSEHTSGGAK